MKRELLLIVIIWAGVSFRVGVFTTQGKAKRFLAKKLNGMKVWVESIDDGDDKHFIKDDLIAHVDLNGDINSIANKINELLLNNHGHDYQIVITSITPNKPIQIH